MLDLSYYPGGCVAACPANTHTYTVGASNFCGVLCPAATHTTNINAVACIATANTCPMGTYKYVLGATYSACVTNCTGLQPIGDFATSTCVANCSGYLKVTSGNQVCYATCPVGEYQN
jgi:hypothetical protein